VTAQVQDWLPVQVGQRQVIEARVAQAVEAWSTAWFARRRVTVVGARAALSDPSGEAESPAWRRYDAELALACPARAAQRLLDWVFDVRAEGPASDMDRRVLERVEQDLFSDLIQRVASALDLKAAGRPGPPQPVGSPFGRLGGVTFTLGEASGGGLLSLAAPLNAILPLCRRSLPPPRPTPPPAPRAVALGHHPVTIEAVLGMAEISVSELRRLEPGDVLILDRKLGEPTALALPDSDFAFALAQLSDQDGRTALTLMSPARDAR